MKIIFSIAVLALGARTSSALAANCQGQSTSCFDSCAGSYVPAPNADSCGSQFNSSKGCYEAYGYCSTGAANTCQGQSTSCFDSCAGSYVPAVNADSCGSAFNSSKGCYEAYGYCSK